MITKAHLYRDIDDIEEALDRVMSELDDIRKAIISARNNIEKSEFK